MQSVGQKVRTKGRDKGNRRAPKATTVVNPVGSEAEWGTDLEEHSIPIEDEWYRRNVGDVVAGMRKLVVHDVETVPEPMPKNIKGTVRDWRS